LHSELMSAPTTINNCECNVGMLQQLKIHVWSLSWCAVSFPPTQHCKVSHECISDCIDWPPCFYCLGRPIIQPRLGSICFLSLPETEGTSESTLLLVRCWNQDSSEDVVLFNNVHSCVMIDRQNYLEIWGSVLTAELVMLGSNCIKLHSKIQNAPIFVSVKYLFHYVKQRSHYVSVHLCNYESWTQNKEPHFFLSKYLL
jgi:hypothetical protein